LDIGEVELELSFLLMLIWRRVSAQCARALQNGCHNVNTENILAASGLYMQGM
jgi:hypothetical protein